MKLLFLMDPVSEVDPRGDSTCALMEAAAAAGHELWVAELRHLQASPAPAAAACQIVVAPWFSVSERKPIFIDNFDVVFIRTDPPFNEQYLWAMHILDLADKRRTVFVNDPAGIRAANEKLYSLRFPELIPPTLVSADRATITEFVARHGKAVIKPVDGHAGRGVLCLAHDDPNLPSLLDLQTARGSRMVVAQRFLDASAGSRRIFMADGQPIACVNRLPVPGDFRTGDVVEVLELSPDERRVCCEIGPALFRDGLRFVGLDVIGGFLIEVNVTSPGGLRQLERLSGRPHAAEIMTRLLTRPNHQTEEVA